MAHVLPPTDDAAHYLLGPRDILTRVRTNQLGPTTLSNSLCAHWSAFFGRRNDLRLGIKRALFPGFETMARRYMVRDTSPNYDLVPARLRELEALCSQYGVSCSCVMPPTNQMNDTLAAPGVLKAAAEAGIPAALPVPNSQLSNDKYADGYHLNPAGQEIFTAAVADYLTGKKP
jgi:DNA polymerase III epsilon subunit-like protein